MTPDEFRRYRAATRFSVGDGIRLRGLDPAHPSAGCSVVIVDGDRTVRGVAVLTDTGTEVHDQLFALWTPPPGSASRVLTSMGELLEQPWVLVDAGLTWNGVVRLVTRSSVGDVQAFERAFLILDPEDGRRRTMTRFDAPELPAPSVRREPAAARPAIGIDDLTTALTVLASIKEAYAAYECDHQRVLAAPALADVTEDLTATFVEAFTLAVALEPERPEACPPDHAARFRSAVAAAEAAWEAAEAHATRLGVSGFDPAQRAQIRRARQALDLALRADTPAGERAGSLAAARRLLDGLVTFPSPLEAAIARVIPAAARRPALEQ